jgi:hypothetical protein
VRRVEDRWDVMRTLLVGALASALLAATVEAPSQTHLVQLQPQNASGEAGTALLVAVGKRTQVVIVVAGEAAADTQPANLHSGSCYGVETIRYVLSDVRGGRSTTLLDVPLARLTTGRLIVNVQESPASLHAPKDARSVSCGSITRARSDRAGATDGSLR